MENTNPKTQISARSSHTNTFKKYPDGGIEPEQHNPEKPKFKTPLETHSTKSQMVKTTVKHKNTNPTSKI